MEKIELGLLQDKTEQIQKECHQTVEAIQIASNKLISYQDATNVFLFRKLAELELKLETFNQHID